MPEMYEKRNCFCILVYGVHSAYNMSAIDKKKYYES